MFSSAGNLNAIEVRDITKNKVAVSGGYFTSDPTAYVAAGKVTSTGSYAIGGTDYTYYVHEPVYAPAAPVVTVPVSSNEGKVSVGATVSGNTAKVVVTDQQLQEVASSAAATGTVTVDVSGLNVSAAVVPARVVAATDSASGSTGLAVELSTGSVKLDSTAVGSLPTGKDMTVSVETVAPTALTAEQKTALGDQAADAVIVDVNVLVGGAKQSEFNGGSVTVSVPYTPKAGQDISKIVVWFIRDDGTIEPHAATYDPATGKVSFSTTHLSQYVLASFPFTDVPVSHWAYSQIAWAYNNGYMTGKGGETFQPAGTVTRQQVWMVLARMSGAKPADMAAAKAWAVENGISDGSNSGSPVTRQQLAALLYRYAQKFRSLDAVTAEGRLASFPDGSSVASYAAAAMSWAVEQGILQGGGDGKLNPAGNASRTHFAVMLQRFAV